MMNALRQVCVDHKLVTKNNKLNQRAGNIETNPALLVLKEKFPGAPIKVAIDIVFNHDGIAPNCAICSGELDFEQLSNYKPIKYTHRTCSSSKRTSSIDWKVASEARKKTMIERYGIDHNKDVNVAKAKKTKLERYGTETYVNVAKAKKTKLERYGIDSYNNREKSKATCIEKYQVSNPLGSKEIIEKSSVSLDKKYGGRGFASAIISERIRDSCLEKYGNEVPMKNEEVAKESSMNRRKIHFGNRSCSLDGKGIEEIYGRYVSDNTLSISKLASILGFDKRTLLQAIKRNGFVALNRTYSCSKSLGELAIKRMIQLLDPSVLIIENDRIQLEGKEIDLYFPELNIGIEYNGSYWHREEMKGDSHKEKYELACAKGIRLVQIFDFDLVTNLNKIEHLLTSLFCKPEISYARKCTVKEIDAEQAKTFANEYHLQGHVSADTYIGLFKDDELVQLMSFGRSRFTKKAAIELLRFCVKPGITIVGGAERMFKFYDTDQPIVSYCDNRFFSGNVYAKLGFKKICTNSGYFWSNGKEFLNRYQTQKHKLVKAGFDANYTETEIMKAKGFYKIRDAGQSTWMFNCASN